MVGFGGPSFLFVSDLTFSGACFCAIEPGETNHLFTGPNDALFIAVLPVRQQVRNNDD